MVTVRSSARVVLFGVVGFCAVLAEVSAGDPPHHQQIDWADPVLSLLTPPKPASGFFPATSPAPYVSPRSLPSAKIQRFVRWALKKPTVPRTSKHPKPHRA